MKKLSDVIHTNGHVYRLIERTEHKALYSQHTKTGQLAGHEIFKIKIGRETKMPNGTVIPERELFPRNKDFGITAWSVGIDRKRAILKYQQLKVNLNQKKEAKNGIHG